MVKCPFGVTLELVSNSCFEVCGLDLSNQQDACEFDVLNHLYWHYDWHSFAGSSTRPWGTTPLLHFLWQPVSLLFSRAATSSQ